MGMKGKEGLKVKGGKNCYYSPRSYYTYDFSGKEWQNDTSTN